MTETGLYLYPHTCMQLHNVTVGPLTNKNSKSQYKHAHSKLENITSLFFSNAPVAMKKGHQIQVLFVCLFVGWLVFKDDCYQNAEKEQGPGDHGVCYSMRGVGEIL